MQPLLKWTRATSSEVRNRCSQLHLSTKERFSRRNDALHAKASTYRMHFLQSGKPYIQPSVSLVS